MASSRWRSQPMYAGRGFPSSQAETARDARHFPACRGQGAAVWLAGPVHIAGNPPRPSVRQVTVHAQQVFVRSRAPGTLRGRDDGELNVRRREAAPATKAPETLVSPLVVAGDSAVLVEIASQARDQRGTGMLRTPLAVAGGIIAHRKGEPTRSFTAEGPSVHCPQEQGEAHPLFGRDHRRQPRLCGLPTRHSEGASGRWDSTVLNAVDSGNSSATPVATSNILVLTSSPPGLDKRTRFGEWTSRERSRPRLKMLISPRPQQWACSP